MVVCAMVVSLMNLFVWRGPVHGFVRSPEVIDKLASAFGYFSKTTGSWEVALYRRN